MNVKKLSAISLTFLTISFMGILMCVAYCLVKTVKEVVVQVLLLGSSVSEEVLKHRAMVEYAKESDITEYVPIL